MFTSSSFFDEPEALYPTVEEQVEMAKKIANSLTVDTNQKSKGANMFYKRVKKSSKWIHEGEFLIERDFRRISIVKEERFLKKPGLIHE